MTLYEEPWEQFRNAPSRVGLAAAGLAMSLLASWLAVAALNVGDLALAWLGGWRGPLTFHAPMADDFHIARLFESPPLGMIYAWSPPLLALLTIATACLILFFWPGERSLSSLLFSNTFAVLLVVHGTIAPAFLPNRMSASGVDPLILGVVLLAMGAAMLVVIERRTILMLSTVYPFDSPVTRLEKWFLRVFPGLAIIGGWGWLNGYPPLLYACAIALCATLFETLAHLPRPHYERIENPRMREAAASLPILALGLAAAAVYVFGSDALSRPPRAIVFHQGETTLERLSRLRQITPAAMRPAVDADAPQEPEKIKMDWSR